MKACIFIALLRFAVFWSCFIVNEVLSDNPTSIVPPYNGSDPGYIIAECNSGLANRLRVMAAYMYIAERKFDGAHLVFIWDKNEPCPGHFLSLFEPISNVIFATNSSRYVLDKRAKVVYENSFAVFSWIMQMNGIPKNKFGHPSWSTIERNMYTRYVPVREAMLKVGAYVARYNVCNCSAMHIRQTDMDSGLGERRRTNLQAYFRFVEGRPPEEPVYLLCDSPQTQRLFLDRYGRGKILVYRDIDLPDQQRPLVVLGSGKRMNSSASVEDRRLPIDHRFTSLEHTLIDVLVAAHAHTFRPSPFSSLSELVRMFESVGKRDRGWCGGGGE